MSDQSIISRREALIAAASIGTAVATTQFASAEGPGNRVVPTPDQDASSQKSKPPEEPLLKLSITLTDGQVVTFNAREAVIDFFGSGKLLVRPTGVMPVTGLDPRKGKEDGFNTFRAN